MRVKNNNLALHSNLSNFVYDEDMLLIIPNITQISFNFGIHNEVDSCDLSFYTGAERIIHSEKLMKLLELLDD